MTFSPRPETVQIGDTVYVVAPLAPASELDGQYHASSQTIEMRSGLPYHYGKYILVHEIVHGLFEHAGAVSEGDEKFTEEQVACLIGRALPALLKNNPQLVAYLTA